MMAANIIGTLAAVRIDLVGTTADFPRFDLTQPLPINHLLCENRRTQGRIGEVGLGAAAFDGMGTPAQYFVGEIPPEA